MRFSPQRSKSQFIHAVTRVASVALLSLTTASMVGAAPLTRVEGASGPARLAGAEERSGKTNGRANGNGSTEAERQSRKRIEDPLTGIVINRSITVLGKDFYHYFVTAWRHKDGDSKYTITVYERPSARWGSEIWIEFRRTRMFHTFMSPARQAAREISEEAADIVYRNIMDNEVQRALFKSPDLAEEEL